MLPDDHILKDDPEMALLFGYCMSEWDMIEYAMLFIFEGVLNVDHHKAEKVFWSQQSVRVRIRMIRELCKHLIPKEKPHEIKCYLNEIEKLNEDRNKLIHGLWMKDGDKDEIFRTRIRPDMQMRMVLEDKLYKKDIKDIGERFAELRRRLWPFALKYSREKLQERVEMAIQLAPLRGGTVIKLGKDGN